jgi:phospholipid/cholesterol/gamma-HCH transport system ATP-binding protein
MIKIENVYKSFDGNHVFKGISLKIKKGEVIALIGISGCGKSVLLKHVAGLLKPDKGHVFIDGKEINQVGNRTLASIRSHLGFLFQGGALFDSMSVFDNVAFPLREKTNLSDEIIRERVYEELEHVGLSGSEHKFPSQISGGMIKRAAIARALVLDPKIMLFDEPTTGLDPIISYAILDLIDACRERVSFTGIIVTHELKKVFRIVNRVIMLDKGMILMDCSPKEFYSSKDSYIREFVGDDIS